MQALTGSRESRDPGIFSWSKSRDFLLWNPGIFRDLLEECKGTFYGPSGPSATALGGQNILTVRTHLKTHSGEKSNATNMDSCRRFEETFESTQRWKVKQMHVILHLFRQAIWDRIWKLTVERSQKIHTMLLYTYWGRRFENTTTTIQIQERNL